MLPNVSGQKLIRDSGICRRPRADGKEDQKTVTERRFICQDVHDIKIICSILVGTI
jgi:hypothetical protein